MSDRPGATRNLAQALTSLSDAPPPSGVRTDAQRTVLDWLGSALAGSLEPPACMARCVAAALGTADASTVLGGGRASAASAAFANGVAAHILELDDIHKGSTVHGAAPIVSAALAVAEREQATGERFLAAVALGYEAALRIGEAVNPSHYRFWHPTGTVATFGAAVAAGVLVRLDAGQMLHALGTAGTQAAGLWEFNADGTMSKHLHPGKAAMNGVLAADLAKAGFTGASRILEGERGFFAAMSASPDPSRITDGLGSAWKITENGYKLHACCGHTHTAIDVALSIRASRGWSPADVREQVASIAVDTYAPGFEIVKETDPATPYRAKFSMAYCVAVALLEGRVGLEQFSPDRFSASGVVEPATAALLPRMRVEVSGELTAQYPQAWPARVTLALTDGTRVCGASSYPLGNAENPVATTVLQQKFRDLIAPRFGEPAASAALGAIDALPRCGDMSEWLRPITPMLERRSGGPSGPPG